MTARGEAADGRLTFGARSARMVAEDCPRSGMTYAPDRFSGTVRDLAGIFEAVNNDGAFDVDEPYTFRRTSCEP